MKSINDLGKPDKLDAIIFSGLVSFKEERSVLDILLIEWCNELKEEDLDKPLRYANFKGEVHNKRLGDLILHVFLHQIHHRGQVTTLFVSRES